MDRLYELSLGCVNHIIIKVRQDNLDNFLFSRNFICLLSISLFSILDKLFIPSILFILFDERFNVSSLVRFSNPSIFLILLFDKSKCFKFVKVSWFSIFGFHRSIS